MFNDAIALLKGFLTTVKYTARPAVTIQYPGRQADAGRQVPRPAPPLQATTTAWSAASAAASARRPAPPRRSTSARPRTTRSTRSRPASATPTIYEINMIRCIFCGFCEEACPVDAIKLGPEYELADFNRKDFVYTKEMLLDPAEVRPAAPVPRRRRPLDGLARRPHDARDGLSDAPPDWGTGHRARRRTPTARAAPPSRRGEHGRGTTPPVATGRRRAHGRDRPEEARLNDLFVPLAVGCAVALVSALLVVLARRPVHAVVALLGAQPRRSPRST